MSDTAFHGRTVVVTGGSRGIGAEIAASFPSAGATVVTLAPHDADILTDITDEHQVTAAFDRIGAEHGRVDVLINNAGGARPGPAATYPAGLARKAFDLNVLGVLYASQCAYSLMAEPASGGVIVNIGS